MATIGGSAPYAVTQRSSVVGVTSGPTTTSTAYVDLPDMAVTLMTTGGDLLAWLQCDWSNSLAGGVNGASFALSLDGTTEYGPTSQNAQNAGYVQGAACVGRWTGVAAGSHTVKGRWQAISGGTVTAATTRRVLLVMEVKR
jgi:hypothetical protein